MAIRNVVADPAPDVEILDFNERGTLLAVRPCCHTREFWQVYFDTNNLLAATFGAAGFPPPHTVERDEMVIIDGYDSRQSAAVVEKSLPGMSKATKSAA